MGKFLKLAVAIALSFTLSIPSHALDDDDKSDFDVLSKAASKTLVLLGDISSVPPLDDVWALKSFNNPDVIDVVIRRLDLEVKRLSANEALVKSLLFIMLKYAQYSEYDKEVLLDRRNVLKNIYRNLEDLHSDLPTLKVGFDLLRTIIDEVEVLHQKRAEQSKTVGPKEILRLKQDAGQSLIIVSDEKEKFVSPTIRLQKFADYLEKNLIGQPEVKEALYDLEFEAMVKGSGNIKEPPFFLLMGLPGNGKDTAVETYVDGLWGKRGAFREHMYRVDVQRTKSDAWNLLGSAKGYIGSETFPEFVRFLVKHSGGKYFIKKEESGGRSYESVELHPDWKPGQVLKGYFPPEKAVVFLNEFHDWSSEAKALILKQYLEKGIISISSSGSGLSQLELPGIRIFAATNEGIGLLTNRDEDGIRYGSPLEYNQMMSRHEHTARNKDLLKQVLARTALRNPVGTPKDEKIGTPEEIRNRTHPSRIILLEPLSPQQLQKIIRIHIEFLNEQYYDAQEGAFGSFEIAATDKLVQFIQEYDYLAEDNARPMKDKIRTLLEYPFNQGLKDGNFTPEMLKNGVTLDVRLNKDKTSSLILLRGNENPTDVLWEQPIRYTFKERDGEPISDAEIDRFSGLENRLKDRLFGQPKAVRLVSKAALLSADVRKANKKHWNDHERATSFAFLGPSSTGKSELAKALVNEIYPEYGEERRVDIDFNKIQSEEELREMIWGRKVGRDPQHSEFMRKYDQYDGDILFVFEEGTNTPRKLLMSLYDLFRENHPKFADGRDRPMTRVTIIMTGNAGIKWYSQIPRHVPLKVQIAAWRMVYEKAMKDPEYQRATLEEYMPEPLINRIGQSNIIWFSPLDFQAIRELTVLKLANNLEKLKPIPGRRGWDVGFRTEEEKNRFVEIVEKEGFYLHEQGASIDRYAEEQVQKGLRELLLLNKIPISARVALVPRQDQTRDVIREQEHVKVDVLVEGRSEPLVLEMYAQTQVDEVEYSKVDQILVAAHEAGHELVRNVLLGDKYKPDFITVIPGVDMIDGKWIYYAGLASYEEKEKLVVNREAAIRMIAIKMGGFLGEQAASRGERHGSGKSNDIERATAMAEAMVTRWGLEPEWGAVSESVEHMSEQRKDLKEKLVQKILNEATELAKKAIQANSALHLELSRNLALHGKLESASILEHYKKFGIVPVESWTKAMEPNLQASLRLTHNVQLIPEVDIPYVANINDIIEKDRQQQIAKARVPKPLPILLGFQDMSLLSRVVAAVQKAETTVSLNCKGYFN